MSSTEFKRARRHLGKDPVFKDLIGRIGPCTLQWDDDHFGVLARSIISQQISGKAARAIGARVLEALGRKGLKPRAVIGADDALLRAAGLSANKLLALKDLANRCVSRELPLTRLKKLDDEDVIAHLTPVRGIGRWTAEMFLIFSLGRLDVLPVGDYGLRAGVQRLYQLDGLPGKAALEDIGAAWKPYRSIATWYVWRSFGAVPQSE